MDCLCKYDGVI
jgi:hypothetical protein